jgi:saccharopine dehydrogenase-like NADP-dependent oxidoreductase
MAAKDKIVLLGAGKSAAYLIHYLSHWTSTHQVSMVIADAFEEALTKAEEIAGDHCSFVLLPPSDTAVLEKQIEESSLVISLLPVAFHYQVALACLKYGKHLVTASYVSSEIQALENEVKHKGLTFLFECGLDPGIDHMSALSLLAKIQRKQEEVISFISSTGGLVDPRYEGNNPWKYKFTWNPRNVVLAGKGIALFRENGLVKKIPYHELFSTARKLSWNGKEELEFYPNRDSFKYQELYHLQTVQTFIRGTIRRKGYCEAWNVLVQLGMTEDETILENVTTYASFLFLFMPDQSWSKQTLETKLQQAVPDDVWEKIDYLTLDSHVVFRVSNGTAATYLQEILESKWALNPNDKDWVLMQHRVKAMRKGIEKEYVSTLSVKGENSRFTAMAKTVGLPVAMAAVSVLTNSWRHPGIHIPLDPQLYEPILEKLKTEGVSFEEEEH